MPGGKEGNRKPRLEHHEPPHTRWPQRGSGGGGDRGRNGRDWEESGPCEGDEGQQGRQDSQAQLQRSVAQRKRSPRARQSMARKTMAKPIASAEEVGGELWLVASSDALSGLRKEQSIP